MTRPARRVSGVVWRYAMLFAAVFLMPLLTFVLVNSLFVIGMVEDITIQAYAEELRHVRMYLEAEVGGLRRVSQAIVGHEILKEFWYAHTKFNSGAGYRSLQEIATVSGFFDHIALISFSRSYLLTNQGSYPPQEFFTRIYSRAGWVEDNIEWNLRTITAERVVQFNGPSGSAQSIAVFIPNPTAGVPPKGSLAFFFSERMLSELIRDRGSDDRTFFLFGSGGELLYSSDTDTAMRLGALSHVVQSRSASRWHATLDLGDESHLLAVDTLDPMEWKLVAASPRRVAIQRVTTLRNLFLIVVAILTVAGIPLLFAVIGALYRPLRHLAESLGRGDLYGTAVDEWQLVERFVHDLRVENVQLRAISSTAATSSRSRALSRLLEGQFETFADLGRVIGQSQIAGVGAGAFVAAIAVLPEDAGVSKSEMVDNLNKGSNADLLITAIDGIDRKVIPMVVRETRRVSEADEVGQGTIEYLTGFVHSRLDCVAPIGVGRRCPDPTFFPESLSQARLALEYSYVLTSRVAIAYPDIKDREGSLAPPPQILVEALDTAMSELDVESARSRIRQIVRHLREDECSMSAVRSTVTEAVSVVWDHLHRARLAKSDESGLVETLLKCENARWIGEFESMLVETVEEIAHKASYESPRIRTRRRVREVCDYLESDYADNSLTLSRIAERFGFSPSNLTHHFKAETKQTVMAYLEELRLARSQELLLSTDEPVSSIVRTVGYVDTSNFIRKFKKRTGMTPGGYRERYGH